MIYGPSEVFEEINHRDAQLRKGWEQHYEYVNIHMCIVCRLMTSTHLS